MSSNCSFHANAFAAAASGEKFEDVCASQPTALIPCQDSFKKVETVCLAVDRRFGATMEMAPIDKTDVATLVALPHNLAELET
ncbi:hypothetical protein NMY22_g11080 [Coprinellus aureogranulatus]|nr:hypothetical protein NMY22_g11080 [Coprinellus aureogranulatus]